MHQLIKAERTGNWQLHFQSLIDMLPYFAAAGHFNYLRSAYFYVQRMIELKQTNPQIEQLSMFGLHAIRRSDRIWAGLSADIVIKEVFMRSVKTPGKTLRMKVKINTKNNVILIQERRVYQKDSSNRYPAARVGDVSTSFSTVNSLLMKLTRTEHRTSDQHK